MVPFIYVADIEENRVSIIITFLYRKDKNKLKRGYDAKKEGSNYYFYNYRHNLVT